MKSITSQQAGAVRLYPHGGALFVSANEFHKLMLQLSTY